MVSSNKGTESGRKSLVSLAHAYGAFTEYQNVNGKRQKADPESLVAVLKILGAPLERPTEAEAALRIARRTHWQLLLEPVTVAWSDEQAVVRLRFAKRQLRNRWKLQLQLEQGAGQTWELPGDELEVVEQRRIDGIYYVACEWRIPGRLPLGYHMLSVETNQQAATGMVIVAPRRAFDPDEGTLESRNWGSFLPLYALRSSRNWGCGDFQDLAELSDWTARRGGQVLGTLPLLATFLDEPFEPSPYSPASRLFWNELYINVEGIPELQQNAAAQAIVASADFRRELDNLRQAEHVDYCRQMALKRRVLAELSASFFRSAGTARHAAYAEFLRGRPEVEDYGRYRAVGERLQTPWTAWPEPLRSATVSPTDYDIANCRYHCYVQWIAAEQMRELAQRMNESQVRLYLDLPLGVNLNSYDVWRFNQVFALGASGGCPPDAVFTDGQDWGFPPMHPIGIRQQRYQYVISYLRHQLQYARMLRIDHMPVFHRLYWVPSGTDARHGVYVKYPAEELYAVFSLESHRHRTLLVGEDLGTVPPEVPQAMHEHNVQSMYVVQYALQPDQQTGAPLPAPTRTSVAGLNTHDMPPFAAFVRGQDIQQRDELDMLGDLNAAEEIAKRRAAVTALCEYFELNCQGPDLPVTELLEGCLAFLSRSEARTLLLNLEDLWGELRSQNIPGTRDEVPNWRRKASYSLAEIDEIDELKRIVELVRSERDSANTISPSSVK